MWRRAWPAGVLVLLTCACSSDASTSAPPGDASGVEVIRGVEVRGGTQLDVVTSRRDGAPVVVLLHGTLGERSNMEPFARRLADDGALAYLASWPVIEDVPPPSAADELYRQQVDAVACAVDHARRSAPTFGGDPRRLAIVGYSGGGMVGAAAALADPAPWDLTCAGGSAPDLFIGLAGDYRGTYQYGGTGGAAFSRYSPFDIAPTNHDLVVRLVHGTNDRNVNSIVSASLSDHLVAAGLDATFVTTDGGHADMIIPTTPEGDYVASLVGRWIRGEDADESETETATVTFDGARCAYDGPAEIASGDTVALALTNSTDRVTSLSVVSVRRGVATPNLAQGDGVGSLGAPPTWVETGGFRDVAAGSIGSMTWRITDADHRWIVYCLDYSSGSDGTMYAATRPDGSLALLTPTTGDP